MLNLKTTGKAQELIKAYLEKNASPALADKINNGVYITKEGKRLLNKKDLDGFMKFANGEARKLAEKGANSACVEDNEVYGWAIHYFEENSIEGTLYNEDGTEYKKPVKTSSKPVSTPTASTVPVTPPKPKNEQASLFDMLADAHDETYGTSQPNPYRVAKTITEKYLSEDTDDGDIAEDIEDEEEEIAPVISVNNPQNKGSELYRKYMQMQDKHLGYIVFIRLGDFYEALGDSAIKASKVLDLTLTGRDCGLEERVAMCGIPYHAADNYFKKLVEKGYKVAVVEELSSTAPVERVISGNKVIQDGQTIDVETGEIIKEPDDDELPIEELSVEEMEKFDYDGDETEDDEEELITVSKLTEGIDTTSDEDAELAAEREIAKAFNSEVVAILAELLDGEINIA